MIVVQSLPENNIMQDVKNCKFKILKWFSFPILRHQYFHQTGLGGLLIFHFTPSRLPYHQYSLKDFEHFYWLQLVYPFVFQSVQKKRVVQRATHFRKRRVLFIFKKSGFNEIRCTYKSASHVQPP